MGEEPATERETGWVSGLPSAADDIRNTHATVFVGGFAPHTRAYDSVIGDSLLIAADSGWEHAIASGRTPDLLVGDMDSIPPAHLAEARAAHTTVIEHPAEKDETDTEIALTVALEHGAERITVVAGGGDRPDHVFAMLHSLASGSLAAVTVEGWLGATRFHVCRAGAGTDLATTAGDTVSLLPVGGDANVTATGMRWPLDRSDLRAHASRGMSNVATGPSHVTVHEGTLIAFITEGDDQ